MPHMRMNIIIVWTEVAEHYHRSLPLVLHCHQVYSVVANSAKKKYEISDPSCQIVRVLTLEKEDMFC